MAEEIETCRRCQDEPANAGYGYCQDCVNECGAEAMDRLDY